VPATAAQMEQVIDLLQGIRDDAAAERDKAAQALQRTPYSGLQRFLPETKEQWYVFIGLLVAILTLILQGAETTDKPAPPIDEEKIVREINERIDQRLDEERARKKRHQGSIAEITRCLILACA